MRSALVGTMLAWRDVAALAALLLLAVASHASAAEEVTVHSAYYRVQADIPVRIEKPGGPGPFPAVVWLHPCAGLAQGTLAEQWAASYVTWGYLIALPDSFTPRGITRGICTDFNTVPAESLRVADAFATLRYLQTRPDVIPSRIAVQGHSHGGLAAFSLVREFAAAHFAVPGQPGFAAAIAFYLSCNGPTSAPLATPLLIVVGAADTWTPAERCERAAADWQRDKQPVSIQVYPGAGHFFDDRDFTVPAAPFGFRFAYDAQAAEEAFARVHDFLQQHLKGPTMAPAGK